jgi:hypothetical protein
VRTTMPMNINGNWNGGGGIGFNVGLGQKKFFNFDIDLGGDYTRRVGFYNNGQSNEESSIKSITQSINLNPGLEFSYRKDQISISLNGRLDYAHSKNDLNPMGNLDTYDFSYGAELEWNTPWGTSLSTDIGMSSRRGYSSSEMNTNELLWNAQIAQSFFKGRALTIMLEVNDILGQQSNYSRNISALMRTDSHHNAIYQYGMLRVIYRFNILGGKNNLKAEKKRDDEWDGEFEGFGEW